MNGSLYEKVALLDPATPRQRILALAEYPHLGSVLAVPILHIETATLARYWPIVWIPDGESFALAAIIGLRPKHGLTAHLEGLAGDAIPLAVKAFPLLLGPSAETGDAKVFIHAMPDLANDSAGESAFDSSGNLGPGTAAKADILWLFAAESAKTRAMTSALVNAGGLGVWKLRFQFEDKSVTNEGYYAVEASFLQDPQYIALAGEHGPAFVAMIEHHILARPRVQDLADKLGAGRQMSEAETD